MIYTIKVLFLLSDKISFKAVTTQLYKFIYYIAFYTGSNNFLKRIGTQI